jgi:hypothetical protein
MGLPHQVAMMITMIDSGGMRRWSRYASDPDKQCYRLGYSESRRQGVITRFSLSELRGEQTTDAPLDRVTAGRVTDTFREAIGRMA